MRASKAAESRADKARRRLGLPTPCPDCSNPSNPEYCQACVKAIALFLGMTVDRARSMYGLKGQPRVRLVETSIVHTNAKPGTMDEFGAWGLGNGRGVGIAYETEAPE